MRIGIDFDNTIVCYDEVFCDLAKNWKLIDQEYQGNKHQLRQLIQTLPSGDEVWQRLQGKVYGEFMQHAKLFSGFNDFLETCQSHPQVEVFIVSHKSEYGHYDEKRINLREAASQWLRNNNLFANIPIHHVFFESTREEKISRIRSLQCTHFIDDLIEVLTSPLFPTTIERILFQPELNNDSRHHEGIKYYTNWTAIKNDLFSYYAA